jgi:hypothetical protein
MVTGLVYSEAYVMISADGVYFTEYPNIIS